MSQLLDPSKLTILCLLRRQPNVDLPWLANVTGLSRTHVYHHLTMLRQREMVDWRSEGKNSIHLTGWVRVAVRDYALLTFVDGRVEAAPVITLPEPLVYLEAG